MAAGLMNHSKGARRVGKALIAPGSAAVITDDSWGRNPVVVEWVTLGILEVVPVGAVESINAGMDKKKAVKAAEVEEQERAKEAEKAARDSDTTTPPAGSTTTPPAGGNAPPKA